MAETMKERLVELLEDSVGAHHITFMGKPPEDYWAYLMADYLLHNGALVPTFQIGEKVFVIDIDDEIRERNVSALFFRKSVCVVYTRGPGIFGSVYEMSHSNGAGLHRTREEAEQELKERRELLNGKC